MVGYVVCDFSYEADIPHGTVFPIDHRGDEAVTNPVVVTVAVFAPNVIPIAFPAEEVAVTKWRVEPPTGADEALVFVGPIKVP